MAIPIILYMRTVILGDKPPSKNLVPSAIEMERQAQMVKKANNQPIKVRLPFAVAPRKMED